MCRDYSCIVTRDYQVLDHPMSNSHEDIKEFYCLKDDKLPEEQDWVPIEIVPREVINNDRGLTEATVGHYTTDSESWVLHFDCGKPPWWTPKHKEITRKRLKDWQKNTIITATDNVKTIRNRRVIVIGKKAKAIIKSSGVAEVYRGGRVVAYEASYVELYNSEGILYDHARGVAHGKSHIIAGEASSALLLDESAGKGENFSLLKGYHCTKLYLIGDARGLLYDDAEAEVVRKEQILGGAPENIHIIKEKKDE